MKIKITFLLLFFLSTNCIAQKENNVWIFGNKLGVDFNTTAPSIISSSIVSYETSTSICDTSGKLMFYSNGLTVWDNTHTAMPNGSGLLGCDGGVGAAGIPASASLGVAIAPIQGYPKLFYLFTLQEQELYPYPTPFKGEFRYSIIDMSLNGGKGDIVSGKKNILIDSQMSERMTVVKADCGVWIITHHSDKHTFYSYKIDSKDSIHKPVISDFSTTTAARQYLVGQIKSSPDETKIAFATNGKNTVELFDFDKTTGLLSSLKLIESGTPSTYSVEFSADNSKLYTVGFSGFIAQYDLSLLPSVSAVSASKYIVDGVNRFTSLRLATNGKIYVKGNPMNEISVIHYPNLSSAACSLEVNAPSLKNTATVSYASFGNKTVSISYINSSSKLDTSICDTNIYVAIGSPINEGYLWNDGDTSRIKTITTSGTYWRKSNNKCQILADTFVIKFISKTNIKTKHDTTVCSKLNSFILALDYSFNKVIWSDGDTAHSKTITSAGLFWRKSEKNCTIYTDTFQINLKPLDTVFHTHDTVICFANQFIASSPLVAYQYLWDDGSINQANTLNNNGKHWVQAIDWGNCTIRIDTFNVSFINFSTNINDTAICKDETITINASTPGVTKYKWQNNSSDSTFTTNKPGIYWVETSIGNCKKTDTINVFSKNMNLNLGDDTMICENSSIVLVSNVTNAQYLWNDGSTNSNIQVNKSGKYSLKVRKDGCEETDDINVTIVPCSNCLFMPNAFTPNNDNKNDLFRPIINCPTSEYSILIVNRYGQEIFSSNTPSDSWDGTFNGQKEGVGVYFYLVKVKFNYPNAQYEIYKGDVSLIR